MQVLTHCSFGKVEVSIIELQPFLVQQKHAEIYFTVNPESSKNLGNSNMDLNFCNKG